MRDLEAMDEVSPGASSRLVSAPSRLGEEMAVRWLLLRLLLPLLVDDIDQGGRLDDEIVAGDHLEEFGEEVADESEVTPAGLSHTRSTQVCPLVGATPVYTLEAVRGIERQPRAVFVSFMRFLLS